MASSSSSSSSSSASASASAPVETVPSSVPSVSSPSYRLDGLGNSLEDILFCVDADRQIDADMKSPTSRGHSISRLDAIKQSIFLFVFSKLSMNPRHRFAFTSLPPTSSPPAVTDFTSDMDVISNKVRNLTSTGNYQDCDLSLLLRLAAVKARKSQGEGRIFRVILIYCRSEVVPKPLGEFPKDQCSFVLDVLYLHDKPSPTNCPQRVYDALVEALEKVNVDEGYIYENGTGLTRILFRQMCCLLAHPQQRCTQDDFEVPKDISKLAIAADGVIGQAPTTKNLEEFGAKTSLLL